MAPNTIKGLQPKKEEETPELALSPIDNDDIKIEVKELKEEQEEQEDIVPHGNDGDGGDGDGDDDGDDDGDGDGDGDHSDDDDDDDDDDLFSDAGENDRPPGRASSKKEDGESKDYQGNLGDTYENTSYPQNSNEGGPKTRKIYSSEDHDITSESDIDNAHSTYNILFNKLNKINKIRKNLSRLKFSVCLDGINNIVNKILSDIRILRGIKSSVILYT